MNHPTSGVHLHQGAAAQLHQNISGEHLHQTCRTIPGVAESQIHTDSGLVSALDREVHLHLMDVEIGEPNHTDLNFFFLVTFKVVRICLFRAGIVGSSLLSRLIMFTMHQLGLKLFMSLCVIVTRKILTRSTRARYLCQDDQRQKTSICLRSIKSPDDISF